MKTANIIDVFVYIQSKGMPEIISNMANHLSQVTGVTRVNMHPKVKQLLAIEYDPAYTSGKEIINIVRQNDCSGFLVGM